MRRSRWTIVGAVALAFGLLVQGDAARAAMAHRPAAPRRSVTLWLDWYPNSDHAGIYVALARGYYARAGLDVQARVPSGAADALKLVSHGSGDIAISYEPSVLIARAAGIPVVATAAIVQRPLNCILTLRGSGITRPRQLEGKTVGIAGEASDYTDLRAMVQDDGGDFSKVKLLTVNYALQDALLKGRVDAVEGVYWTWEALLAEQSGHPVNVMRVDRYGVPSYDELVFVTGQRQLASEGATLRAFQRATFQGYAYAAAHPAEAARILVHAPGVLSTNEALIERSLRLLGPVFHDDRGRYGTLSAPAWQTYADWMTRTHLLSRHVDARAALTLAVLP